MDDLEFVRRCVNGNKQSWDEFVNKYSRLIYNYIHSVLHLTGSAEVHIGNVNDLFQEIFLSLVQDNFRKLRSFRGKNGCTLASWLRQITVHATLSYLRKTRTTLSLDEENDDELSPGNIIPDTSVSAKDMLLDKERLKNLTDCIEELNLDDKYFLELHLNQNMNLEALRGILGISRGAADMRKGRIIDRLKDCFKHKGFALDF